MHDALLNTLRASSQTAAGGSGARSWPEMEVLRACHCMVDGQDGEPGLALHVVPLMVDAEEKSGKWRTACSRYEA